tara:strand:+ start:289 stop:882 length:594 start_codon:yes stop_codon:yes gene_type:complete
MYKLGITGGIGSGKTTASSYLKKKFEAYVFDADTESKNLLLNSTILQRRLINTFGNKITKGRKINLSLLANEVFESKLNQELINGIMWPEIYLLIQETMKQLKNSENLFIVDAALIYEANIQSLFDSTLLITSTKENRLYRNSNKKRLSIEQFTKRMALQMSDRKKTLIADKTITNNQSLTDFHKKLDSFYKNIINL